jgi:hypothetical protein
MQEPGMYSREEQVAIQRKTTYTFLDSRAGRDSHIHNVNAISLTFNIKEMFFHIRKPSL